MKYGCEASLLIFILQCKHIQLTYLWSLVYCPGPEPPGPDYDIVYSVSQMQSIDPDMFDGKTTVERIVCSSDVFWKMNWGYDGKYDNGYYGVNDTWYAGFVPYQDDKIILHNFSLL